MSALSLLPSELKIKALEDLLRLEGSWVFENPGSDELGYPVSVDPTILRTCNDMYPHGLHVLYGKNEFKFTEISHLRRFVLSINATHPVSHFVTRLWLVIDTFNSEIADWVDFLDSGDFAAAFPHLMQLDILFTGFKCFTGYAHLSPVGTADFDAIICALMGNARAAKPKIYGIWGPGASEIGDMAESAMTRGDIVEVDDKAYIGRDKNGGVGADKGRQYP